MKNRPVWIESGAICSKKSPTPLKLEKVEHIYVKEYDGKSKLIRASLIALVFSFAFFLVHPLWAAGVFPLLVAISFFMTKSYELRVLVFNNDEVGSVESGLCSANDRKELDKIVLQFEAMKKAK